MAAEEQVHLRSKTRRERVRGKRNEQGEEERGLGELGVVAVHRTWSLSPAVEAELGALFARPGGAHDLRGGEEWKEGCRGLIGGPDGRFFMP